MKTDKIPPEIQDQVEAELLAGEELLWVGQPTPGRLLFNNPTQAKTPMVMGGMVALLLGIFLSGIATAAFFGQSGVIIALLIALLSTVVLAGVLGVPAWNYFTVRKIIYAITDRRALIINGKWIQSYGENDLQFIERKVRWGGMGDIIFTRDYRASPVYLGSGLSGRRNYEVAIGFFGIKNVREVEALMLETFRVGRDFEKPKHDFEDIPEDRDEIIYKHIDDDSQHYESQM